MLQFINEALVLTIALGTGIYAYSYMNKFTRTLFFQLLTWIVIYLFSRGLTIYQSMHNKTMNDQWIFNIQIPLELLLLTVAACYFLKDKLSKYLALTFYMLFLIIIFLQFKISGPQVFINYGMVASGFSVTVLYTMILYQKFKSDSLSWKQSPEIWASLGLIIYFACNIPYFSLFTYLNSHHSALSTKLFFFITDVLANIRYIFLAIAFWMVRKHKANVLSNAT